MYNRYIPQSDGSYRRSSVQEPPSGAQTRQPPKPPRPPGQSNPPPPPPPPKPEQRPQNQGNRRNHRAPKPDAPREASGTSAESFLRQLLPKDFCSEDLLVVLLLLLMAGDRQEDQGSAMLTLALYLFM